MPSTLTAEGNFQAADVTLARNLKDIFPLWHSYNPPKAKQDQKYLCITTESYTCKLKFNHLTIREDLAHKYSSPKTTTCMLIVF